MDGIKKETDALAIGDDWFIVLATLEYFVGGSCEFYGLIPVEDHMQKQAVLFNTGYFQHISSGGSSASLSFWNSFDNTAELGRRKQSTRLVGVKT